MRLMDTDVCVDLQREHPPAQTWLTAQTEEVAIPGFVAIELIAGCRNKAALKTLRVFLASFALVWPSDVGMTRAIAEYAPLRLSHNLGGFDALIAATATEFGAELLTFNTKHFAAVPGLIFCAPYVR